MIRLNLESLTPSSKIQLYAYYGNDIVVPSDLRQYGVAKEEITISPNHRIGKDYIIKNTEIVAINRTNKDCDPSLERTPIAKCVSNFLENEMNCSTRLLEGNQTIRTFTTKASTECSESEAMSRTIDQINLEQSHFIS